MKKLIFAAAIAALALVSCSKTETSVQQGPRAVKFSYENIATYTVKASAITDADPSQVGIFAADLGADNVAANVAAGALTPATTIYWGAGQTAPSTFVAYYPYAAGRTLVSSEFIPPYNQNSTSVDFTVYDNFLTAVKTAAPDDPSVEFKFTHPYAKLRLNIDNQLGADVVDYIKISGIKLASAIDISTGAITPAAEATDQYPCPVTENAVYELVLVPQTASPTIEVNTVQGSKYVFAMTGSYAFAAGAVGVASLTLANASSGTAGLVAANLTLDLSEAEWTDGAPAAFGEPSATVSENYWYVIGTINDTNWDEDFPMVIQSDGGWKITLNYTAGEKFKIRKAKDWTTNYGLSGSDTELPLDADYTPAAGGTDIQFAATGVYDIYFHPTVPKIYAALHQ